MKSLIGLEIEALSVKELENLVQEIRSEYLKNFENEKMQYVLNKLFRFIKDIYDKRLNRDYIDFDENTCYCGHVDCDNYSNLKTEFSELVNELAELTKESISFVSGLIYIIDKEAYERDANPNEKITGLFELLMNIFDVLICDTRIVPCVDIEEMQHKIVARKEVPGIVLADIDKLKDLKKITDLKKKFPQTKFFVFSTDGSMALEEKSDEVTVISWQRINSSNIFQGSGIIKKE